MIRKTRSLLVIASVLSATLTMAIDQALPGGHGTGNVPSDRPSAESETRKINADAQKLMADAQSDGDFLKDLETKANLGGDDFCTVIKKDRSDIEARLKKVEQALSDGQSNLAEFKSEIESKLKDDKKVKNVSVGITTVSAFILGLTLIAKKPLTRDGQAIKTLGIAWSAGTTTTFGGTALLTDISSRHSQKQLDDALQALGQATSKVNFIRRAMAKCDL